MLENGDKIYPDYITRKPNGRRRGRLKKEQHRIGKLLGMEVPND